MVKITFLNLLRSKYGIETLTVEPGKMDIIFKLILSKHPEIEAKDFQDSVMFVNQKRIPHATRFETVLCDGDEVVFTHFLGGG
jgi:molybdopterin converting factor small subunit